MFFLLLLVAPLLVGCATVSVNTGSGDSIAVSGEGPKVDEPSKLGEVHVIEEDRDEP